MKIIQLTDLHLELKEETAFGIDTRANFLKILDDVLKCRADYLIITGDICFQDGDQEIYDWLKEHLDEQPMPYELIPGNHDSSILMAQTYGYQALIQEGEYYFAKRLGKANCIFLDSSRGEHSKAQLKWLERQLKQFDQQVLLFMHHPPVKGGVPFMDNKYPLRDREAVMEILHNHPHPVAVFCGHYHAEKTILSRNVMVQITPSCFFQIDSNFEDFKVDHHRIAFREIIIEEDMIRSELRYTQGIKIPQIP